MCVCSRIISRSLLLLSWCILTGCESAQRHIDLWSRCIVANVESLAILVSTLIDTGRGDCMVSASSTFADGVECNCFVTNTGAETVVVPLLVVVVAGETDLTVAWSKSGVGTPAGIKGGSADLFVHGDVLVRW